MRRQGKSASTWSSRRRRGLLALAIVAAAAACLAPSAFAAVASKGVVGFFGKAGGAADQLQSPRGVAVNQGSGDVYAVDGGNNRVEVFDSSGKMLRAFGVDVVAYGPDQATEVQMLDVAATSGNFKLSFEGASTPELSATVSASQVEAALNALPTIGEEDGSVSVSGGPGDATGSQPYRIVFDGGSLNQVNAPQIGVSDISLAGGAPTAAAKVGTPVNGETGFEICVPSAGDTCKSGSTSNANGGMNSPQGIAIDQTTGDVYVTDQSNRRVDQYDEDGNFIRSFGKDVVVAGFPGGSPAASAVQTLTVTATGGKYTLEFGGDETAELPYDATAAEIQSALQGLGSIGSGNATVTESSAGVFPIAFAGDLADNAEPSIVTASGAGEPLSGGTATIANTTSGSNGFEVCGASTVCKAGAAAAQGTTGGGFGSKIGYPAVAPAGAPNAGDLLVADPANLRVQEFGGSGAFLRAFGFDTVKAGPDDSGASFEVCSAAAGDACQAGAAGSGSGQFAAATPTRVAEDAVGDIYTVEPATNFRVQKFTLPGNAVTPQGSFDAADLSGTAADDVPTDVAVSPGTENVLVNKGFAAGATANCPILGTPSAAESRVVEVSSAGALEGIHAACAGIASADGLAVSSSSGDIYVPSTYVNQRIYVLDAGQPVAPTVSIDGVSGINGHEATVEATIDPHGPELPYGNETGYLLEYKRSSDPSFSTLYDGEGSAGDGSSARTLTIALGGLKAGTSYEVRLTATKGLGSGAASDTTTFSTAASKPDASLSSYIPIEGGKALLEGFVDPNGLAAEYHFDYISQSGFEAGGFNHAEQVPAGDEGVGSGAQSAQVSQAISGLSLGTTYHYRLVAKNTAGESSAAGVFTTAGNPSSCPNARLRAEQTSATLPSGSTFLPRCMGLELVTPPLKFNQYAVEGQIGLTDNRIEFISMSALDSPRLGSVLDKYMAERSPTGWSSEAMQMGSDYTNGNVATGLPCAVAPDLSSWTTYASTESQAKLGISNVLRKNSAGTVTRLGPVLSPFNTVSPFSVGNSDCFGGSADGSHFYFAVNGGVYGENDPEPSGGEDIYDVYNPPGGEPRSELIQRDRNGVVVGGSCGAYIPGTPANVSDFKQGSTSPDGSWLYFSTRPHAPTRVSCNDNTYPVRVMRRDLSPAGPEISEVGESECDRVAPVCDFTNGDDTYMAASADGSKVFFTTTRQLVDTDLDSGSACGTGASSPSPGCDLYVYDYSQPVGSRLTQVSAGDATDPTPGSGAEVLGIAGIAGDGSHAYFVARGVLTTTPNEFGAIAKPGEPNLYVYEKDAAHPGGRTAFVGQLASSDSDVWTATGHMAVAVPLLGSNLEDHAVGGDGHLLVLVSDAPLTPDDTDGGHADLFRYDSDTGDLERISKAAPGGSDNGPYDVSFGGIGRKSALGLTIGGFGAEPGSVFRGRKVSEDAQTIAFVTAEKLSPSDTDEEETAYIWTDGNLVPIPEAGTPSVSASGKEVAFTTAQQLLVEDGDGASDVYVARVDGGFPIPVPPVPCSGEACQGPPGAQPSGGPSATETTVGAGNVQPKKHKKKHHKKHRKHHRRCHKKKCHKNQKKCHHKKCRGSKQHGKGKQGRGHQHAGRKQGGHK